MVMLARLARGGLGAAELSVLIATPRPQLAARRQGQHVDATALDLCDRLPLERLDESGRHRRGAVAAAERTVLALPKREDLAFGVEHEGRTRTAHDARHARRFEVIDRTRQDARRKIAEA
jgi:hypothetical protein